MALRPWLVDRFAEELLLGNHWLEHTIRRKRAGRDSEPNRDWEGVYCDNGSCLDITNSLYVHHDKTLRVLQTEPLTLTDGRYKVVAHLTADCSRDFSARFPGRSLVLRSYIAVRKYTIQITSYGPHSEKLRFILHELDWLGVELSPPQLPLLKLVNRNGDLSAVLRTLHETRAKADRCLASVCETRTEDTVEAAPLKQGSPVMEESTSSTQAPHTQAAFGTQFSHPIRASLDKHDPQFIGAKQIGPVLAGNTQRQDIKPSNAHSDVTRNKLLSLLGQGQTQRKATASAGSLLGTSVTKQQDTILQNPPGVLTQHAGTKGHSKAVETDQGVVSATSPALASKAKQAGPSEPTSPAAPESARKHPATTRVPRPQQSDEIQALISECPWMTGFEFSRESFQVPHDQSRILQQSESWHKPSGLQSFPEGNVPIQILRELSRLADEKAAAEEDPETDHEEGIDPSPDSIQEETVPSPGPTIEPTQDDDVTATQVSWSSSPTPEPPQKRPTGHQELPPDSSFESDVVRAEKGVAQHKGVHEQQSQRPQLNKLPTKRNSSIPPSSPPVMDLSADSDEEMEMEISVPQGLGEDAIIEHAPSGGHDIARLDLASPEPKPVVQVEETPYRKSNREDATKISAMPQQSVSSRNHPNETSSTSIIRGTFDDRTSSRTLENDHRQVFPRVQSSPAEVALPKALQLDPRSMKRKLDDSPSKNSKRHTKRREIKLVGFGTEPASTTDHALALQKERAESFQKFQEKRRSHANIKSHPISPTSPVDEPDDVKMEIDTPDSDSRGQSLRKMSPRHASLYNEPAPVKLALQGRNASQQSTLPLGKNIQPLRPSLEGLLVTSAKAQEAAQSPKGEQQATATTVYQSFKLAYPEYTGGIKHFAGLCKQMYELDQEDKMVPKWQWDDFIVRNRTDYKNYAMDCADKGEDPEPYHRFYKDSISDTIHKKGVIVSNRTLLKAFEELGVERPAPEPLMQPAKSLEKKISRSSLPAAFQQHGNPNRGRHSDVQRDRYNHAIPISSHGHAQAPNKPLAHQGTDRPLQSISSRIARNARATEKLNMLQRLSSDRVVSPRTSSETTGDPFRDYCFAMQRTTSWTGSSEVDPSKPWPENLAVRPSIADAAKPKVDVLKWRDAL